MNERLLRDSEWNLQESMKRPSPLPSVSLRCLADFSFLIYCSLCVREGVITLRLIMWGLQQALCFPSFHLSVQFLFILFLSFILIKS